MEFRILGPLEAVDDGRAVHLGGPKQRALLALLVLSANRVVSTETIIDELWGGRPPPTARRAVHVYVAALRSQLGSAIIATRPPGYALDVPVGRLDYRRFEAMLQRGREAAAAGDPASASHVLQAALALWRGPTLGDLAAENVAEIQSASRRLDELRLVALESRIEADLELGKHAELVGELESVVAAHPLREALRRLLMLALYRAGRQAEALDVYRQTRRTMIDELGIEPSPSLQALERAILEHDTALDRSPHARYSAVGAAVRSTGGPILAAATSPSRLDQLAELAVPLAHGTTPDLVLACLVPTEASLGEAIAYLDRRRAILVHAGTRVRVAAFTSDDPATDVIRLAREHRAGLVLVETSSDALASDEPAVGHLLRETPCDLGVLVDAERRPYRPKGAVLVPFGGGEEEWAAAEHAARFAEATARQLTLTGTIKHRRQSRDASRLLATASLLIQNVSGVLAAPLLVPPGAGSLLSVASDAGLLVIGLSDRWRTEGIGATRLELAKGSPAPVLLIRGALAPVGGDRPVGHTRYPWSSG